MCAQAGADPTKENYGGYSPLNNARMGATGKALTEELLNLAAECSDNKVSGRQGRGASYSSGVEIGVATSGSVEYSAHFSVLSYCDNTPRTN